MRRYPLVLVLCFVSAFVDADEAITILPLGDSITAGGGGGGGYYRHHLNERLSNVERKFQFVGPNVDNKGLRHAGFSGWNSDRVLAVTKEIYAKHAADVVLLHVAHNHFSENDPVDKIVANTRSVIEIIAAQNPQVTIFLAQAITAGKLPKYSYIPALNERLTVLVAELQKRGVSAVLVDQASGFDWRRHTVADKVHPNELGAKKMADVWAEAIHNRILAKP